jgi:hypothetical protein
VSAPQPGVFEEYTSQDLVVQGRYFHAARDLDPISMLADLASFLQMPHTAATSVPDLGADSTLAVIFPEEEDQAAGERAPESAVKPFSVDSRAAGTVKAREKVSLRADRRSRTP